MHLTHPLSIHLYTQYLYGKQYCFGAIAARQKHCPRLFDAIDESLNPYTGENAF